MPIDSTLRVRIVQIVKPTFLSNAGRNLALTCILATLAVTTSGLLQAAEVSHFNSTNGPVRFNEMSGRASFQFEQSGKTAYLPDDWRESTVERVVALSGPTTAVVISYSSVTCAARQALMIITKDQVAGPYQLGGCEDSLAYQVSIDRNSLVAIRTDARPVFAWVYTADTREFRGPTTVVLPGSLAKLMSSYTEAVPHEDTAPAHAPIKADPVKQERRLTTIAKAALKSPTQPRDKPSVGVQVASASESKTPRTFAQGDESLNLVKAAPVPTPSFRKPALSANDAEVITQEVKKSTKAQPQVTIDLR